MWSLRRTRPRACLLALLAGLLLAAPVHAASLREEQVKEQQADNAKWEAGAKEYQNDLYKRAEEYYKAKKYDAAGKYYRKAISITYKQWDIRESTPIAHVIGAEDTILLPARRKIDKKLKTDVNQKAELKLDTLGKAKLTDTAQAIGEEAKALQEEGKPAEAYALYARIAGNALPRDLRKKWGRNADKAMAAIDADATKQLDAIGKLVADGDTEKAKEAFAEFRKVYGDFAASEKSHARYLELAEGEEFQKLLRHEEASAKLARIEELLADKDLDGAYDLLKESAPLYEDTEPGKKMITMLAEFHADKNRMRAVANEQAGEKCKALMRKAANYTANNMKRQAARAYRKIIERYPDTDYAAEAQKELDALTRKP